MPTSTSSNGMNTNASAHKENQDQNATLGGAENFSGRNTTPTLGAASEPTINSGMSVGASVLPIKVKPVDFKSLAGSFAGDHRAGSPDTVKSSMDQIAAPPSPREQMRGQQNSKNYSENGKAFKSTSNGADSDAGN